MNNPFTGIRIHTLNLRATFDGLPFTELGYTDNGTRLAARLPGHYEKSAAIEELKYLRSREGKPI